VTDGIVGEAGAFLRALGEQAAGWPVDAEIVAARGREIAALKAAHPAMVSPGDYASEAAPLQPAALCRVLNEILPDDAMVFIDAGNCVGWGLHCLLIDRRQEFHSALAMGPMGFGVCGVIGARYGRPDRLAVALVGDGALMMHLGEISTAAAHRVGAIWVVLADGDLRMVSQGMDRIFKAPGGYDADYRLGTTDLRKVAEGLGADAHDLHRPEDLRAAWPDVLRGAAAGRPQLLVAHIDTKAAPPFWIAPYASPQLE
jgi:acetolactate synthase-1/2/3 large subunit